MVTLRPFQETASICSGSEPLSHQCDYNNSENFNHQIRVHVSRNYFLNLDFSEQKLQITSIF